MVTCMYCAEKTILYINGEPVCLPCAKLINAGKLPLVTRQEERLSVPRKRRVKVRAAGG